MIRPAGRLTALLALVLALAGPAPAVNILTNSSFELWLFDIPVGWLTSEPLIPGSATRDSAARTGDWCVRLIAPDTSAFVATAAVVRSGVHYGFSGWAWVPGLVGGSFAIQFLTIGLEPVGLPVLLPAVYSGGYREHARWVTAPDGAALVSVGFASLPGATVRVDDITLEDTTGAAVRESPAPGPAAAPRPRRVFATPAVIAGLAPGTAVFDPAGRRLASAAAMRPFRVYFIIAP
ncbi:MAG: hypothetical protein R6X14_00345 [bacterium]